MELDRRQLLGGIGAAAAGVAAGAALTSQAHADQAAAPVTYAQFNEAMRQTLRLDSNLVGVKFYESAEDVPEGAVSPKRDLGKHIATCQAFSMARYNGQTVVMTKEDEWCWAPLVGYGQVDCSEGTDSFDTVVSCLMIEDMEAAARFYAEEYPRFELGKYAAWVVAPLSTMDFEPDVVLAWGDPYKINWMCLIAKRLDATTIVSNFDGIDSCVYEMVNTMDRNNYQVCFPDCGEVVRARTKQTDATFCIPASKLQAFMDCACGWGVSGFGFNFEAQYDYALDYSRPPFYNEVFGMWGLDTGTDWAISNDYGQ